MNNIGSKTKEKVDLLVYNATVYTVDGNFPKASAFAVKDGRFVAIGYTADICAKYTAEQEVDMNGKSVYPGFHDAHCHFVCSSVNLSCINLKKADSYDDVLKAIEERYENNPSDCIVGYGLSGKAWDSFSDNKKLNELYPDTPVILRRICEHVLVANEKAIELLREKVKDINFPENEVPVDKNGTIIGIFKENTVERFWEIMPQPTDEDFLKAAKNLYKYGLTSVSDAGRLFGLPLYMIKRLDDLQQSGDLSLRIDAWLKASDENFENYKAPYRTDRLTVSCVKLVMDGGMGARTARMLAAYKKEDENEKDKLGIWNMPDDKQFLDYCKRAYDAGLQVATHCIGDAANRKVLEHYGKILETQNYRRWRIEHAQIIAPEDFEKFEKYSIVPSVQPTHATSDMDTAENIIGDRVKGAYAYKQLKEQLGWIPFGTDFPVEEISPINTFFAAVFRKNSKFEPKDGFQNENAVSREDALRAMTIWAARASFDEGQKGSIEQGKWADFVVLDRDIMTADEKNIPDTKVLLTFIAGKEVFNHENKN